MFVLDIAITTKNPFILEGIDQAFSSFFPGKDICLYPYRVETDLKRLPIESEIFHSANTRIRKLKNVLENDADFLVSYENGLISKNGLWFKEFIILIQKYDGQESIGISGGYLVPLDDVTELINSGKKELDVENSKQGVGRLPSELMRRTNLIKYTTLLALSGLY